MKYLVAGGDVLKSRPGFRLVGRDRELRELSAILMRSKASSVILVGAGGVGSTAMSLGLQASKADESAPFDIIQKRFFWLQYDELFSEARTSEEATRSFQRVMTILRRTPDSVLHIEDTRDFIEAARNAGCPQVINGLSSAVKRGETQAVLEVKDDDLGFVLKSHADMRECYTIYSLDEPSGDALHRIVESAAEHLSGHHAIRVAPDAVSKAIELTTRYQTRDPSLSRAQPERTTTLLDRALSSLRLDAHRDDSHREELHRLYDRQRDGELAIIDLEEQIEDVLRREEESRSAGVPAERPDAISTFMGTVADSGFESTEVRTLRARIADFERETATYRESFDELVRSINSSLFLDADTVLVEFAKLSGIAPDKLNQDELEKLKSLGPSIKANLWGQDHAVDRLVNAIRTARVGRRNGVKPQASFMFLGPSGVGKTEIVKLLSREMDMELLRFDMSEYMEKNAVNTLIGAPAGYEGYENGGTLTKAIKKNPRQVVLFDEIEKADPAVFNIFLQVLDAGRLTDRFGQTVSFSESIIVMTSNIGQAELLEGLEMRDGRVEFSVDEETRHANALRVLCETPGVRPEFLNRFNGRQNVVFFNHLDVSTIARIVRREIDGLNEAYRSIGVRVSLDDATLDEFCRDRYDVRVGGRGLPGYIQAELEPRLTDKVLDDPAFRGTMLVGYVGGRFTVEFEEDMPRG